MIIVLIHVFYLLGKLVFHRYQNIHNHSDQSSNAIMNQEANDDSIEDPGAQSKAIKEKTNLKRRYSNDSLDEEASSTIRFKPPAYIQRYEAVQEVLKSSCYAGKLKKVVDFGCSELGFSLYIKNIPSVQEALFVDIDREVLEMNKKKLKPLNADYLHRRTTPYVCRILEGSVTQHDKLLQNCDAVVCIELIEHLYPEPLTTLPFNIFGFIRPKVAVITTPNADFNVLFTNLSGFRHPDHKFEWTRKQFQDWGHNIVSRFPEYEVSFHGIGYGPSQTEHLGACSQMAVFHKHSDIIVDKIPNSIDIFKCVMEYEYPFEVDNRSDEEKILDDAVYFIRKFSYNDENILEQLPLQKLLNVMDNYYISINALKEILENADWTVVDCEDGPAVVVPQPSFTDNSFDENDFWDNDIASENLNWDEEAGPPLQYFTSHDRDQNNSSISDDWDVESDRGESSVIAENENRTSESAENYNPFLIRSNNYSENYDWDTRLDITESNVQENVTAEPTQYYNPQDIEFEEWGDVPDQFPSNSADQNETTENASYNTEVADSTPSIHPDDVCLDDIVTESRSTEFANSALDESILMSSYSETKGSENSESAKISTCQLIQASSINSDNKIDQKDSSFLSQQSIQECKFQNPENDLMDTFHIRNSMCSMFLEPSQLSRDVHLEDLSDPNIDCIITSPLENKSCKKLKLNNSSALCNMNENTFEKPKYTSSPQLPTKFVYRKRKVITQKADFCSRFDHCSKEVFIIPKPEASETGLNCTDNLINSNISSNESVIAESKLSVVSPQICNSKSLEKSTHYTGTKPKNINRKLIYMKINSQIETKLEQVSLDTPDSPQNSWSPEIMDSGYPNSNSTPNLSPEYDLSSIAHDLESDSESSSIIDLPRIGFLAEAGNRDLANNNLDPEGNNIEAIENQHINDLHPLIHVLEHDLENENDIYDGRNNFPLWLLRILQRLDADGVEINMPMLHQQNENIGE